MNRKKFIVILAFAAALAFLTGCGEQDVVQLSELQQIDGVYVVPKTQKPYSGKYVTAYENNAIKEAGSLKNGKRHGEIKSYDKSGNLILVGHYKDGDIYDENEKPYKTVKIGTQTWMAENLNYDVEGSKCYENNPDNCTKYGGLYNWETALNVCPPGWHLPSKNEWDALDNAASGKKLKAKSGWNENGNGTDEFGFSALPGGGGISEGYFRNVGNLGGWWSASEFDNMSAYFRGISYNYENAHWFNGSKSNLQSVRCLQD